VQQTDSAIIYDQDVVIFTACDRHLAESFKNRYPHIATQIIADQLPKDIFNGRLWCFVAHDSDDYLGIELCHKLRAASNTMHGHITILLKHNAANLRQAALQAGADDYIVGALSEEHVLERVQLDGMQHTPANGRSTQLVHGELRVDLAAYRVHHKDSKIFLPLNEFRLLVHFMQNPDRLLTRAYLIDVIGRRNHVVDERTVDVWVGRLRRILSRNGVPDPLRTVRSMGYVFDSI
jgi:two-component system, OmpR family, phosphate regulon response regulator PhoB